MTNDGIASVGVFKVFQVLSNELNTPKVLYCPVESDGTRVQATIFTPKIPQGPSVAYASDLNCSYFVGVDACDTNVQMFLAGDRNLTLNGQPLKSGRLVNLDTNAPVGWTAGMHKNCGNVLLVDGSVQQWSSPALRQGLRDSGVATNRLAVP